MNIFRRSLLSFVMASAAMSLWADMPTQVQDIINVVKTTYAPDSRQAIFEVTSEINDGVITLAGTISEQAHADALTKALTEANIAFESKILVYPANKWGQVRLCCASLRYAPKHAGELVTQAVMGTPVRMLQKTGEWWRVQTPDGYIAYIPESSVIAKSDSQMEQWRNANRYVVSSPFQIRAYQTSAGQGLREIVSDLVLGCIVEVTDTPVADNRYEVRLPDGRCGWVDVDAIQPVKEWATQEFDAQKILDIAYSMEGATYLWGGTSPKAVDCSGLAKVSYYANGLILMRDASQQAQTGTRIEPEDWRTLQPGDLLYFGNKSTGRVTHVAIHENNGDYVHSSGWVRRNSVNPESDKYLTTPFLWAVRIHGNEGTAGITRVAEHPWYF